MKQRTRIVGTDTLFLMVKNLWNSGEITEEQYRAVEERHKAIKQEFRKDVLIERC